MNTQPRQLATATTDAVPTVFPRPTNGCIRLSNADMQALLNAIAVEAQITGPPGMCSIGSDTFPSSAP